MLNQIQIANRNIKLYIVVRSLAKRVFIPLAAIYFIDTAGFSVRDIGLLAAFYSIVQLVVELPTGYFADRVGRVASIRLGAICCAAATLCYVVFQTKTGIYAGAVLEGLGYSFFGGAGEALIHDSLVVKKLEHEYTKIMSRTMSISLVANAILVALVPLTYAYDPRYPFLLGTLAYLILLLAALFMQDVTRSTPVRQFSLPKLKAIAGKRNILTFALTFGVISALYSAPLDMINVALREYGFKPQYLGWVFAAASIIGAAIGPLIPYLRKVKLSWYLLLDMTVVLSVYIAAYSHSSTILAIAVALGISFYRYRKIIYQSYLLAVYPTSYKATLLSTMNNLEQLNSIWLTLTITFTIATVGTAQGFGIIGLAMLGIMPIFYYSGIKFFARAQPVATPLVNHTHDRV